MSIVMVSARKRGRSHTAPRVGARMSMRRSAAGQLCEAWRMVL
jgi:hypothetical protein